MQILLLTCVTLLPSSSAMTVADSERPSGVKIWVIPALVPQMPMPTSAAGVAGSVSVILTRKQSKCAAGGTMLMLHISGQRHEQCLPHAACRGGCLCLVTVTCWYMFVRVAQPAGAAQSRGVARSPPEVLPACTESLCALPVLLLGVLASSRDLCCWPPAPAILRPQDWGILTARGHVCAMQRGMISLCSLSPPAASGEWKD